MKFEAPEFIPAILTLIGMHSIANSITVIMSKKFCRKARKDLILCIWFVGLSSCAMTHCTKLCNSVRHFVKEPRESVRSVISPRPVRRESVRSVISPRPFRGFWGSSRSAAIRKEIIASDSSERFPWNRKATDFEEWGRRTSSSSTLHRVDPYGIQSCFLDYSLNKKKRLEIPAEFEERIQEIQDPFRNLRVSSSLHTVDHSHNLFLDLSKGNPIVDQPCKALYDVSHDGTTITKNNSKTGRTNMRLSVPPSDQFPDSNNIKHKPLHIHYFAWEVADSCSLYNKRANAQKNEREWNGISQKRPKYFNRAFEDDFVDYQACI